MAHKMRNFLRIEVTTALMQQGSNYEVHYESIVLYSQIIYKFLVEQIRSQDLIHVRYEPWVVNNFKEHKRKINLTVKAVFFSSDNWKKLYRIRIDLLEKIRNHKETRDYFFGYIRDHQLTELDK
jgi:hypothetical protein